LITQYYSILLEEHAIITYARLGLALFEKLRNILLLDDLNYRLTHQVNLNIKSDLSLICLN
jgi:hypothetical protein